MDIIKDIRPLTEFKRDTTRFVLQDEIEFARTVADIRKGLDQADRGEGIEAGALFGKLRTRKA